MKKSKYTALLVFLLLMAAMAAGCGKKTEDPGITAVTPTSMPGIEPTGDGKNTAAPSPTSSIDDIAVTARPVPTDTEAKPTPDSQPDITPTPSGDITEPTKTEGGNNGTKDPENTGGDNNENTEDTPDPLIEEYWAGSFLVWLPRIGKGSFKGFDSDETHDLITLENISEKDVKSYIKKLTKNGFTIDQTYLSGDGSIISDPEDIASAYEYHACNEDGWAAGLSYDPDTAILVVSSGYDIAEDNDAYDMLRAETPLGLLPEFSYGSFDSSKQDGGMYYAVFSNVTGDYADYAGALKEAGFNLDIDEGDSDGILWYYAYNEDGYFCEFNYTDGMARIGCGTD